MTAKHTPGPWIAWDDNRTIGIEDADGEPIAIAEIVDHGDATNEAQLLCDQALIAEAPAMLATLREAVAATDMEVDTAEHNAAMRLEAAIEGMRAILARIDGKA